MKNATNDITVQATTPSGETAKVLQRVRHDPAAGQAVEPPAPSIVHQVAVYELAFLLRSYVKNVGLTLLAAPVAVTFSKRREVQPDLLVMPRLPNGRRASRFADVGVLLLAVEVLSPSSSRTDRREKRWLYQQESVPEYWIVDTDARSFERWTPDATEPEILRRSVSWQPAVAHEPLIIDLEQYFGEVLDD